MGCRLARLDDLKLMLIVVDMTLCSAPTELKYEKTIEQYSHFPKHQIITLSTFTKRVLKCPQLTFRVHEVEEVEFFHEVFEVFPVAVSHCVECELYFISS